MFISQEADGKLSRLKGLNNDLLRYSTTKNPGIYLGVQTGINNGENVRFNIGCEKFCRTDKSKWKLLE